jgi:hypothetical protein
MRRIRSVMLLALAVAGSSLVLTSASASDGAGTLHLRSVSVTFEFFDVREEGVSVGDHFVFSDDVVREGGRIIGSVDGDCTTTRAPAEGECWQQCVGTITLDGRGQIAMQGAFRRGGTTPDISAVTGGTGRFDDAVGEIAITFPPDGSTIWHVKLAK